MIRFSRFICVGLLTTAASIGYSGPASARPPQPADNERVEVSSIKAVRPPLLKTIAALKKGDAAEAKADFEAYDSGWNGIEIYINTRHKAGYKELEQPHEPKLGKG